jgi:flagellar motor switch protein FliN
MTERLHVAAEIWANEFANVFAGITGETGPTVGRASAWTDIDSTTGGEWFAQKFAGTSAAAWFYFSERTRELIAHYLPGKKLVDVIVETSSAFAESMQSNDGEQILSLPAQSTSAPNEPDVTGCLVELKLPSGSCDLGMVFTDEAITLCRAERPIKKRQNMADMELMLDMELPITVSIGTTQIPLRDVLKLTTGSIVELDRLISDPVDILVSNRVIARGEVVVIEGNYGVRILEIVSRSERMALRGTTRRAVATTTQLAQRGSNSRMEALHD